jgi:Tripartite tricarboxylate transporter family receptor
MKLPRRQFLRLAASAAALPPIARVANAETYPARPIRLVVPFPPGGAFDALARPWVEQVKPLLGTMIVENIGGGGSSLGAAAVARARPDGYTILLGGTLHSDGGGCGLPRPDQPANDRAGRPRGHAEADHRADCKGGAQGACGTCLRADIDRFGFRSQSRYDAREIPASPRSRHCFLDAGGRGVRSEDRLTKAHRSCVFQGNLMKLPRRTLLHLAAGAAALVVVSRVARAQTYPSRPVRVIVPFPRRLRVRLPTSRSLSPRKPISGAR